MAKTEGQASVQPRTRSKRSKTPVFDAMVQEARNTPPDDWLSHEALERRLGITDAEHAAARERIERRLREDQDADQAVEPDSTQSAGPYANGTVADDPVPASRVPTKAVRR